MNSVSLVVDRFGKRVETGELSRLENYLSLSLQKATRMRNESKSLISELVITHLSTAPFLQEG
jgi:hypothetical protein